MTSHLFALYSTWHPASHSILMEMREACFKPGTICASLAFGGNAGISISHVCVDLMIFPSGCVISRGSVVGRIFLTGAWGIKKCPVAPASATPLFLLIVMSPTLNADGVFFTFLLLVMTVSSSWIFCKILVVLPV